MSATSTSTHRHPTRSKCSPIASNQRNAVVSPSTGDLEEHKSLIKGKDKETWLNSCSNKLGRLTQGIRDVKGTNCISFIHHSEVPKDKKADYSRIACSVRPNKNETHRTRINLGANVLQCNGSTSPPMPDLNTLKLLINGVVSPPKKPWHLTSKTTT